MGELYDKDGNLIEEVYDSEGNAIDETLSSDEIATKVDEAKEEVKGEYDGKIQEFEAKLEEKEEALRVSKEEFEKEKDKDKNFGNLRGKNDDKKKEIEILQGEVSVLKEDLKGFKESTIKQPVNAMIEKISKGDVDVKKKVQFYYDGFTVPEDDTEENQFERVANAYTLATGSKPENVLRSDVVHSGGGVAPGENLTENKEKISEGAKGVAEGLGISDKSLKKHKLI